MNNNNNSPSDKDHCIGHRKRLLHILLTNKNHVFTEEELLELCLFFAIPRKNVKPLVHALLSRYKYLYAILGAPAEELCSICGVGPQTYMFFQVILLVIQQVQKEKIYDKESFFNIEEVISYCKWKMCYLTREELRVLYFNGKNRLIKDEVQAVGSINHVSIYPREVVKKCLEIGAMGIVLCHNHPSGDATPSREDITATLELQKITSLLNIVIHDHIIIGDNNWFSMKRKGLI